MARLISETLEQEKSEQQHLDDPYEQSTEEVSHLARWLAQSSYTPPGKGAVSNPGAVWVGWLLEPAGIAQCLLFKSTGNHMPLFVEGTGHEKVGLLEKRQSVNLLDMIKGDIH